MKRYVWLFLVLLVFGFFYKNKPVDLSKFRSEVKSVEVKGEVKRPGVYEVNQDAMVEEIIELAGGVLIGGDVSHLNLSHNIENNGVIVVRKQEQKRKISINAASLEELDQLNGIGKSIAQRIIDYRCVKPFASLEELMEVKGIGEKLFEKIKDQICL